MADFLAPFELEKNDCQRITTGGGILLIAPLECPNDEPVTVTYTVGAAVAANDESIDIQHDNSEDQILREGSVLLIGGNEFVVAATTTVVTGAVDTTVPIEPAANTLVGGETFEFGFNVLKMLSITNIPITLTSQKEDSTDMDQGIKSSEAITSVATSIQVSAFDSLEDEALYRYIFREADRGGQVFALALRSNGVITAGRALVSNYTSDQAVKTLSKVQFTLDFQGNYVNIAPFKFLSAAEQTAVNALRAFVGLSQLTP